VIALTNCRRKQYQDAGSPFDGETFYCKLCLGIFDVTGGRDGEGLAYLNGAMERVVPERGSDIMK
jgi:hypothetical protein